MTASNSPHPSEVEESASDIAEPTANQSEVANQGVWKQHLFVLLVAIFIFVNLVQYMGMMPFSQDEARRVIVAQEMRFSGNYIVPTFFQETSDEMPPAHPILTATLSYPSGAVSNFQARLLSVGAFLFLGLLVYWLMLRVDRRMALTAFVVVMTNYVLLCEFGNLVSPAILLTFFIFAAFFFYILNPVTWVYLIISSVFMGFAILTDGFAPLFLYPALLALCFWVADHPGRRLKFLGVHLLLSLILPLFWLILYSAQGELSDAFGMLFRGFYSEAGVTGFLKHLVSYPVWVFGGLLPWTLVLVYAFKSVRIEDEIYRSSLLISAISILLLTLTPGSTVSQIVPAFPFLAIVAAFHINPGKTIHLKFSLAIFWIFTALFFGVGIYFLYRHFYAQALILFVLSLVCLWKARLQYTVFNFALLIMILFLVGYQNGVYFYRAQDQFDFQHAARIVALHLEPDVPVVIHEQVNPIKLGAYLEAQLKRPLYKQHVALFPDYYLLTTPQHLVENGRYVMELSDYPKREMTTLVIQRIKQKAPTSKDFVTLPGPTPDNLAHRQSSDDGSS